MVFQRKPSGCTNQKELNNCIHFRFSEQILAAHSFSQLNYIFRIVDGENVSIQRILVHKIHVISLEFQSFVLCENLLFITFYLEQQDNNNYFFVIRHRNEEWKINKNTNISIHFISAVFFSLIVGTISATFNFNAEIDKKNIFQISSRTTCNIKAHIYRTLPTPRNKYAIQKRKKNSKCDAQINHIALKCAYF